MFIKVTNVNAISIEYINVDIVSFKLSFLESLLNSSKGSSSSLELCLTVSLIQIPPFVHFIIL